MAYKDKEKAKAWYEAHKEELKAYKRAYYDSHRDKFKARNKKYNDSRKDYFYTYQKDDTNSSGVPKQTIRKRSSYYLFNTIKHSKLKGYEIHHCFGYEDAKCFIYIHRELHLQIHQYLRDNNIDADSKHYQQIAHLINEWDGYTYIKV